MQEYNWRDRKPAKPRGVGASRTPGMEVSERMLFDEANEHLRIYFPTDDTVASSKGGRGVS